MKNNEADDARKTETYKNKILTVPNVLSAFRLLLVPALAWLYLVRKDYSATAWVLLLSGATDIADGFIARRFGMGSDLGKALDPIADKLTQIVMLACLLTRFGNLLFPCVLLIVKEIVTGCMGIAVMNIIGCFLQFLGQFRLTVFLHLFCSHIVQDPEQILCSMLIAAALILTDISDAGVVFIQNGIGLCKSDAPAFFRKHLFGFLYSILFGTWTGRSIALIIPASFWGSWFDILWNGTAFSGRKRSAAADFIP